MLCELFPIPLQLLLSENGQILVYKHILENAWKDRSHILYDDVSIINNTCEKYGVVKPGIWTVFLDSAFWNESSEIVQYTHPRIMPFNKVKG